jgi:flagellar hook-associated protein 1 FlgK
MGNLLVSLHNATSAMKVYERAMGVVQGNVANASTPGYAKQQQLLESTRFDLDHGLPGGVRSGGTLDSRSSFAENTVRRRLESLASSDERTSQLEQIEPVLDISDTSGLGGAMNRLFQAFSAVTVAPNDASSRQVVLDRAAELARAFNAAAAGLTGASENVGRSINQQVDHINSTVEKIVAVNRLFRDDYNAQFDAGLQARMSTLLDDLSDAANFTVLRAEDGSATLFLGGQTLVGIGETQYKISADTSSQPARVLDPQGQDISSQLTGGRLEALLNLRNQVIPQYSEQIDRLGQSFADTVNDTLAGGLDRNGQAPARHLFRYDASLGVARTLNVDNLAPSELALASVDAPGGNAVALQLAGLSQSKSLDGFTFMQFYGNVAAQAGRDLNAARENQAGNQQLVSQARSLRDDLQAVNLDEEAALLLQYQRGYQALARVVQTLNDMTDTLVNLLR